MFSQASVILFREGEVGHAWQGWVGDKQGMCGGGGHAGQGERACGRDGHCNGLYASYWNAFLFAHIFIELKEIISLTEITIS